MRFIYRVGSHYGTTYHGTRREADACRHCGKRPESVVRLYAAQECQRLHQEAEAMEQRFWQARSLLEALAEVVPSWWLGTATGRDLRRFLVQFPLRPADAADRDGGRSHGGG